MTRRRHLFKVEWPTLFMLALCYALWGLSITLLAALSPWAAIPGAAIAIALHSSLQHEIIHGHPFSDSRLNALLVFPALGLAIPYLRFRDQHLAHHATPELTDPYDDPESNYLAPARWCRLPGWVQALYRANATLLGRMLLGPLIAQLAFLASDLREGRENPRVALGWLLHLPGAALVLAAVAAAPMPLWAYLLAAYAALSILKIRTFAEHRAHACRRARSVVIEDRGPLAWLFLNNNLHIVHHMHPGVPWYRLPELYAARKSRFLEVNSGYAYPSYLSLFRAHLLRPKDPVVHPLLGE